MVEMKSNRTNWSQLIASTQRVAEADAVKNTDPVVLMEKAALIATAMLEKQVSATDVARISLAIALAKVSEAPDKQDNYREVITSAAHIGQLVGDPPISLSNLRVMSNMVNQATDTSA